MKLKSKEEMLEIGVIALFVLLCYAAYCLYSSWEIKKEVSGLHEAFELSVLACLPNSINQTSTINLVPEDGNLRLHCVKSSVNQDDFDVSLAVPVEEE